MNSFEFCKNSSMMVSFTLIVPMSEDPVECERNIEVVKKYWEMAKKSQEIANLSKRAESMIFSEETNLIRLLYK